MSKIHEALKRAAKIRKGNWSEAPLIPADRELTADPDSTGSGAGKTERRDMAAGKRVDPDSPRPGEATATTGQPPDERPALPFERLSAHRLAVDPLIVAKRDPKSLIAEQFRTLRTRIRRLTKDSSRMTLLVTSPGVGEGKTLVSVNLAVTLAQEVDTRVLLVDCDLRRSKVYDFIGMSGKEQPGLNEFLSGGVSLERVIWRLNESSLYVLGAGATPDNPSELLGSPMMTQALGYLGTQFDHVILDSPPLSPVADPVILTSMADGVIMVVRYGKTGKAALLKTLEMVPEEKMLGLVFNAAALRIGGYKYRYDYTY